LESLNELSTILKLFCNLEPGCRRFDKPEHPWSNRSDFSSLKLVDRNEIDETIDKIIAFVQKETTIILTKSIGDQDILCNSLEILLEETGMFRKFKPKWTQAQFNAKRLLKQQNIPNDVRYISAQIEDCNCIKRFKNFLASLMKKYPIK